MTDRNDGQLPATGSSGPAYEGRGSVNNNWLS